MKKSEFITELHKLLKTHDLIQGDNVINVDIEINNEVVAGTIKFYAEIETEKLHADDHIIDDTTTVEISCIKQELELFDINGYVEPYFFDDEEVIKYFEK